MLQSQQELPHQARDEALRKATMGMFAGIQVVYCGPVAVLQHQHILVVAALIAFKQSQDMRVHANTEKSRELLLERAAPHTVEALDSHASPTLRQARRLATAISPDNGPKAFHRDLG